MSEQEFDSYLRLLSRFLRLSEGQRESIRCELRDHMEARLEDLLASGMDRQQAIAAALDEFGDAAALAHDFDRIGRRRKWIMRSTIGALGLTCAVLFVSSLLPLRSQSGAAPLVGIAAEPTSPTTRPVRTVAATPAAVIRAPRDAKADELARQKLDAAIANLKFDGVPLRDVMEALREQSKLNIDVNWKALEVFGIAPEAEVTVNLRDVKLRTALRLILDNVTDCGAGRLDYVLMDGVVRISTEDDLSQITEIRVYDCRDLTQRPLTAEQRQAIESAIEGGKPEMAQDVRTQELARVVDFLRKQDAQDFVQLVIQTCIVPETMRAEAGPAVGARIGREAGGFGGGMGPGGMSVQTAYGVGSAASSVSEYDGLLVVRVNTKTHERLAELLSMLREAKAARPRTMAEPNPSASAYAR